MTVIASQILADGLYYQLHINDNGNNTFSPYFTRIAAPTYSFTGGTYEDVRVQTSINVGGRADAATLSMIMFAYNTVIALLATKVDWPELTLSNSQTLTSGVASYNLVGDFALSNVRKIFNLVINDGVRDYAPLEYVVPNEWDTKVKATSSVSSGRPVRWTKFGDVIELHPTPDAAYTLKLKGYMRPVRATIDTDVVPFVDCLEAIICASTAIVWAGLEEIQLAAFWGRLAEPMFKMFEIDVTRIFNFPLTEGQQYNREIQAGPAYTDPFRRA
jgi:hypothetical protein